MAHGTNGTGPASRDLRSDSRGAAEAEISRPGAFLEFWVYGTPGPQGSKRALPLGGKAGGRTVLVESSKKVAPWRKAVAVAARAHAHWTIAPICGPVQVKIDFLLPRRKYHQNREGPELAAKYPDLDKLCRSTFDGLVQGGLLANDSLVVNVSASKRIAPPRHPTGARIWVTRL